MGYDGRSVATMITETSLKSSDDNDLMRQTSQRRMPAYGVIGAVTLVLFEILQFAGDFRFVKLYFTPVQWTGLILFLDGWQKKRRGRSLVADHFGEFLLLAAISIGSWLIFEAYNLLLGNWHYVGLPESRWERYFGYAWAFATISPGMFLIYETLDALLPGTDRATHPRLPNGVFWTSVIFGFACLTVPLLWPSTWMTPLVWMGFAFFLDPINGRMGRRSILSEFFTGDFRSMPLFFLAGLVAGVLWEFWNYWAGARWIYDVPYLGHIKIFEMPVLGFLGFMPFAIESFAIYTFVRRLLPIPTKERYLDSVQ